MTDGLAKRYSEAVAHHQAASRMGNLEIN